MKIATCHGWCRSDHTDEPACTRTIGTEAGGLLVLTQDPDGDALISVDDRALRFPGPSLTLQDADRFAAQLRALADALTDLTTRASQP